METNSHVLLDLRRVIASSSVVAELGQKVSVSLQYDDEQLKINFEFPSPLVGEDATPNSHFEVLAPNEATFVLKNFDSPLGQGLVPADRIATLGKASLFVRFLVHCVGNTRLLSYTFTVEDPR